MPHLWFDRIVTYWLNYVPKIGEHWKHTNNIYIRIVNQKNVIHGGAVDVAKVLDSDSRLRARKSPFSTEVTPNTNNPGHRQGPSHLSSMDAQWRA